MLRNIGEYVFPPQALGIARYPASVDVERVLADNPSALAVMAGPMFGRTGEATCGGGIKPCTLQFDAQRHLYLAGDRGGGLTISIVDGAAVPSTTPAPARGAKVAIQGYPAVLVGGRNVGGSTVYSSVAGLGIRRDGKLVYLVGSGGSIADLGVAMAARGVVDAGYMDAGSSAALYVRGEGWRGAAASRPRLPTWLVVSPVGVLHGWSGVSKLALAIGSVAIVGLLLSAAARHSNPVREDLARRYGAELGVDWERSPFTPAQLAVGIDIEREHTPHNRVATKIALDHLRERPNYYELLLRYVEPPDA